MPIQTALDSISQNAGSPFGFKNRIINGGMVIDQRNAGASGTSNAYTVDRWAYYGAQSSKGTWQQNAGSVTPPAGFKNYLGFTSSSSYSVGSTEGFIFYQWIEGYHIADLAWGTTTAQPITVGFWVRSSLTGTHSFVVTNNTDRTYGAAYTINQANTWEYKSVTIPGCTDGTWLSTNGQGLALCFNLGTGSSYTIAAGSWSSNYPARATTGSVSVVGTNGATFYVTGVQVERGTQATSFDWRPITTEQMLCYRYYCKIKSTGNYSHFGIMRAYSTTKATTVIYLPVPLRAYPSAGWFTPVSGNYDYSVTDINLLANYTTDLRTFQVEVTGSFSGASTAAVFASSNSGSSSNVYIEYIAEL